MIDSIKKIMCNVLGIEEKDITDEMTFENTEKWDSLKHMLMIAAFEEEFSIEFAAEEIVSMLSFIDIKKVLTNKGVDCKNGN